MNHSELLTWQSTQTITKEPLQTSVVVWLAYLPDFFSQLIELRHHLISSEQEKADRFYFEKHRIRYTVSQALLRILLGAYLRIPPQEIFLNKTPYGKPFLDNSAIQFNISHSNEYAIYALSECTAVGIDIEYWKERKYLEGIIDSNFSVTEKTIYHNLDSSLKVSSFYQGWTCNEAYIKAIGMGLSFPLADFSVEMDPTKPAKLLETKPLYDIKTNWYLQMLPCPENYSAALARESASIPLKLFLLTPLLIKNQAF